MRVHKRPESHQTDRERERGGGGGGAEGVRADSRRKRVGIAEERQTDRQTDGRTNRDIMTNRVCFRENELGLFGNRVSERVLRTY